jgi:hypothetical protein
MYICRQARFSSERPRTWNGLKRRVWRWSRILFHRFFGAPANEQLWNWMVPHDHSGCGSAGEGAEHAGVRLGAEAEIVTEVKTDGWSDDLREA